MFGWFSRASCPCYPKAKEWVEERLEWIRSEFKSTVFDGKPLVHPTDDFFPEAYDHSQDAARVLLRRVCAHMGVPYESTILRFKHDPNKLWLVNHAGQYVPHAAGTFSGGYGRKYVITVDTDELASPAALIATFAHELAHARLLGEGRIGPRTFDNEMLTDLTSLALGFGLFAANSPRNWDSQNSRWPGTSLPKPEYMTPPMFGYALAHLAWFEGEKKPGWMKYLGAASRTDFAQGVRFLFATSETKFRPRPRALAQLIRLADRGQ
jgi:hypothetical protein